MRNVVLARFGIFIFIAIISIAIIVIDVLIPVIQSGVEVPIGPELSLFACGPITLVTVSAFLVLETLKKRAVVPVIVEAVILLILSVFWLVIGILTTSNPPKHVEDLPPLDKIPRDFSCEEYTALDVLPFLIVAATVIWAISLLRWSRKSDYWSKRRPLIQHNRDSSSQALNYNGNSYPEQIQLIPQQRGGYSDIPQSRSRSDVLKHTEHDYDY